MPLKNERFTKNTHTTHKMGFNGKAVAALSALACMREFLCICCGGCGMH